MNLQRFRPLSFRLLKFFNNIGGSIIVRKVFPQAQLYNIIKINVYFGVSWGVWSSTATEKQSKDQTNPIQNTLGQADSLFENGHYEECYKILKEADIEEKNVEVQWRISRVLYNMAKEEKYDKETKNHLVMQAYTIISDQLQHNWNHFAVQKWYALLLDAKSAQIGIKERIMHLEKVKKHMDLAVNLKPDDATTLHMLGEWCYQITEMPWHQRKIAEVLFATPPRSTYEDALDYFLKAEAAQPRFYSINLLRLGICYLKLNKEDQAKYYLALAASYPAKSNDDHLAKKEATELLKKLK